MPDKTAAELWADANALMVEVDKHVTLRPEGDKQRMEWGRWCAVSSSIALARRMLKALADDSPKG